MAENPINYESIHTGQVIDTAVTLVQGNNCKVKYGNIIGSLDKQTDLVAKFATKVDVSGYDADMQYLTNQIGMKANYEETQAALNTKANQADVEAAFQAEREYVDGEFANQSLTNLNATGEAHFSNPSLNNLNTAGEKRFTDINSNLTTLNQEVEELKNRLNNIVIPDAAFKATILNLLFPVGAVYLDVKNIGRCPVQDTLGGTWEIINGDGALWEGNGTNGGAWISQGLPNHYHNIDNMPNFWNMPRGDDRTACVSYAVTGQSRNASEINSIYGASTRVQPQAHRYNVWKRTA